MPNRLSPEHTPYCIWNPDLPCEDNCSQLARGHPVMKYHVRRTCAVGYQELHLLPDISIAEEAHEAGTMSLQILEGMTKQLVRYSIMNNYTCTVN